ncbi:oligosaccharide flippase family protein [Halapricum sp. CBA1109]|uniref:oligosaccharide flippase family protein n=1 Tax=Halapricum sp. CBA1109 TaxID=2668068 RepID=UPI0018D227C5|nr:oligosaccharide flippase family protein [Halapricum sp. CBA1109]
MSIVTSIGKITAAKILNRILGFAAFVFFARELGAGEFGIFVLFQASLGLLSLFADPAIGQAAEQRASSGEPADRVYGTALLLKSALLVPLIAVIVWFSGPLDAYIGGEVTTLLIVATIVQQLGSLPEVMLRAELRVGETASLMAVRQVVWAVVGAVLVLLGFGFYGLIYGLLVAVTLRALLALYKCETSLGQPSREQFWSIINYAKYQVVANKVAPQLYSWTDVTIIGIFLTSSLVGAYEVAWRVVGIVLIFPAAIGTTIFPHISAWSRNSDTEQIRETLSRVLVSVVSVSIPAFFGVLLLGREILRLIFGPEFTVAWLVLIILMGQKSVEAIKNTLARVVAAMDYPQYNAIATIVGTTLNVVLNVVLVWKFGIVGAAVATTVATIVGMLLLGGFLRRVLLFTYPVKKIGWMVVASTGMAIIIAALKTIIVINSLPRLVSIVLLGVILYVVLVSTFQPLREDLGKILQQIK